MIPLVDNFLWLVILIIIIPLVIALLVAILAFPTEIYEDYVTVKIKEVIQKKHIIFVAISGSYSALVKDYAGSVFKNSQQVYIVQTTGFVQLLHSLRTIVSVEKKVYVCEMPIIQEDKVKITSIIKPAVVIMTSDIQDEKAYKALMHLLPRKVTVLSYKKNILFNRLAKKNHKHILLYGLQNSSHKRGLDIFGYDVQNKQQGMTMTVFLQKAVKKIKNIKVSQDSLDHVLPVVYLQEVFTH